MRINSLIILFIFILILGCVQSDKYGAQYSGQKSALLDWDNLQKCEYGKCTGLKCDSRLSSICDLAYKYFPSSKSFATCPFVSLYKAKCSFQDLDDEKAFGDFIDKFKANVESPDIKKNHARDSYRGFMLGMGSTFGDFGAANRYCGNGLLLSVKWLVGGQPVIENGVVTNKLTTYGLPDKTRAACFLDEKIMPMYILYSDGKNVDDVQAGEVAKQVGTSATVDRFGIGPVILVSEIDYDVTDSSITAKVKSQVAKMKSGCPNCLVALGAPKEALNMPPGDICVKDTSAIGCPEKAAWDALMNDPAIKNDPNLIVAFGINSRNYRASCNNPALIFESANLFAKNTLYKYKKPTIIAYMMFDEETTANGCVWRREVIDNRVYNQFFSQSLEAFSKSGVIGAAPYSYSSKKEDDHYGNPLGCKDCGLGTAPNDKASPPVVADARFTSFFAWCQKYALRDKDPTNPNAASIKALGNLGIFSRGPGGFCSNTFNNEQDFRVDFIGKDINNVQTPDLKLGQIAASSVTCDACLYTNPDPKQKFPTYIGQSPLPSISTVPALGGVLACFAYDKEISDSIDNAADGETGYDAMLVRAVMQGESGFDPCSVSKVPAAFGCNPKGINNAPDQAGPAVNKPKVATNGIASTAPHSSFANCQRVLQNPQGSDLIPTAPSGMKFCAYGVMQANNYPENIFDFYPELKTDASQGYSDVEKCRGEDGVYNPFDVKDSVCLGTLKLSKAIKDGTAYMEQKKSQLNIRKVTVDGAQVDDEDQKRVLSAYFALHFYNRGEGAAKQKFNSWIPDFDSRRRFDDNYCASNGGSECDCSSSPCKADKNNCRGITDFIEYVRYCQMDIFKTALAATADTSRNACKDYLSSGEQEPLSNVRSTKRYDYGCNALLYYRALTENCANSACPAPAQVRTYVGER